MPCHLFTDSTFPEFLRMYYQYFIRTQSDKLGCREHSIEKKTLHYNYHRLPDRYLESTRRCLAVVARHPSRPDFFRILKSSCCTCCKQAVRVASMLSKCLLALHCPRTLLTSSATTSTRRKGSMTWSNAFQRAPNIRPTLSRTSQSHVHINGIVVISIPI